MKLRIPLSMPASQKAKHKRPIKKERRLKMQEDEFDEEDNERSVHQPVRQTPAQAFVERLEYFKQVASAMFKAGVTPETIYDQVAKNFDEYMRRKNERQFVASQKDVGKNN